MSGKLDGKVDQQTLDQEFIVGQTASPFVTATFGWPVLPCTDLSAGGPTYPLSSLGVRVRAKPFDMVTVLAGIFDGNTAPGRGDPQKLNADGTNFSLGNGALFIGETQYALNPPPVKSSRCGSAGPVGYLQAGLLVEQESFRRPAIRRTSRSLASPASTQSSQNHKGNYSFYAVADQMVWRRSADSPQSVNAFARIMGAPGDPNLVDVCMNAGVPLMAPFRGRDDDVVGLAPGYAKIGAHAQDLASDTASFTTP